MEIKSGVSEFNLCCFLFVLAGASLFYKEKRKKKSFICLDEGLTVRLKRSELIMIVSQLRLRYLMKKKILALKGHCSTPVLIHGTLRNFLRTDLHVCVIFNSPQVTMIHIHHTCSI